MDKFRKMEDEMSRFEAEISGQNVMGSYGNGISIPGFGNIPPPPTPPLLIPHQVKNIKKSSNSHNYEVYSQPVVAQPAVVSAKPTLYSVPKNVPAASTAAQQASVDFAALQNEVERKLKKLKNDLRYDKVSAQQAISQGKASSAIQSLGPDDYKRKGGFKNKKTVRVAGGQTWEDPTLLDWSEDDFRIFCGDLGNDVTDELLTRTFNKYPSFQKAKVVRDKRTNKTKGYGFISFKDPADFTRAMKEMNGRYVGSRPIKLRKSCWRNRCVDVVKKKEKEKAALMSILTSAPGR